MSEKIEWHWIIFVKRLGILIPNQLKFRFYKLLYNDQSTPINGVDLSVPHYLSLNLRFLITTKYLIDWNVFFFGYAEKETNHLLFECIQTGDGVLKAGRGIPLLMGTSLSEGNWLVQPIQQPMAN